MVQNRVKTTAQLVIEMEEERGLPVPVDLPPMEAAQQRIEMALQRYDRMSQAILDNTTAVIYAKDEKGRYLLINRWFERLFHVTRTQMLGKTDHDFFPKEMADVFRANDRQVAKMGMPMEFEEIAPQDDGNHTYISLKFPLFETDGSIYAVCGISTDITERKKSEQEFRRVCQQFEMKVQARTRDLIRANADLQQKVAQDRETESTLRREIGRLREKEREMAESGNRIIELMREVNALRLESGKDVKYGV